MRVTVVLGAGEAEALRAIALGRRVPGTVVVRVGLEAERVLERLAALTGQARNVLIERLDAAARPREVPVALARASLTGYAAALRGGSGDAPGLRAGPLELPVGVGTAAAWTTAAHAEGAEVAAWAARRLGRVRERALDWEAAAAEAGCQLGEWLALVALEACSSIAFAQTRAAE